ncbi:MAG TPA: signal peptide peptidase SppA, partial [Acidobacteriota bacterium]|nr:signal peptide peptidase SppA [Acidobacteriota bacterium]
MRRSAYVGLIILFFVLLAAAGLFFIVLEDISGTTVEVPGRGYLEVRLAGPVEEIVPSESLPSVLFGLKPLSMHDFWGSMRKAKVDARIQAVLVRL